MSWLSFLFTQKVKGDSNYRNNYNLIDLILKQSMKIKELENKYSCLLLDIKKLEEENIETTNILYEIMHSIDAVDARIDITAEHYRITEDV
jgi:hypothetical protein